MLLFLPVFLLLLLLLFMFVLDVAQCVEAPVASSGHRLCVS